MEFDRYRSGSNCTICSAQHDRNFLDIFENWMGNFWHFIHDFCVCYAILLTRFLGKMLKNGLWDKKSVPMGQF